ncbi:MAG: hypothetical protein IJ048_06960 [Clostridia bacterium]|nr:hypothetical protein [Clostridia bacterium]
MARLKSNYEASAWARFLEWMKRGGRRMERDMVRSLEEEASPNQRSEAEQLALEQAREERQRLDQERERVIQDRLHLWSASRGSRLVRFFYRLAAVVICVAFIYVLLTSVSEMPPFGGADNPVNNEVSARYIEKGLEETGAVNIVGGMILDYRAFDTLGESHVLFIAACSVMLLLRINLDKNGRPTREKLDAEADDRKYEPHNDVILQKVSNLIVPCLLLFGIYVVLNGHLSAGGGFSGGAIMGAALILYVNAHGLTKAGQHKLFGAKVFKYVTFIALAFYALAKSYSFFMGANHLDSHIPLGTPGDILSAGLILPLNIAVGAVVAWTMYSFYTLFRKGDF